MDPHPAASLRADYREFAQASLATWLPPHAPHFPAALEWVLGRFDEGRTLAELLARRLPSRPLSVLDLGAGNGGVSAGLASVDGLAVTACDCYFNGEVTQLRARAGRSFSYAVGRGEALPFAAGAFDAVVLLDVIEHVAAVRPLLVEVGRVVRSGGLVVITTPPRVRFLLRGDPHHGIKGLALLPAPLQKVVAERLARRTANYDVHHLYWSAAGIARMLPRGFATERQGGGRLLGRLGLDWERLVAIKPS